MRRLGLLNRVQTLKLAGWFEHYAEAMELNYWTGTELIGGRYDDAEGCWCARLKLADGSVREMHPRHIVMATGVSGIPNVPSIRGLEDFTGAVVHSHDYDEPDAWAGKSAIVIGTGNSGHDIAQDLYSARRLYDPGSSNPG